MSKNIKILTLCLAMMPLASMAQQGLKDAVGKYFLIGAIRSLVAGVGKGYRTEDDYTMERYYTCYASDGVTDYEIPGTKNIRIYGLHDIMPEKECIVKIMSPAGSLVPKTVYVDGIKYKVTVVKSHNYSEQIDY